MKVVERLVIVVIVVAVLYGITSCTKWRWNECRKVGHGIAYCIWNTSRP